MSSLFYDDLPLIPNGLLYDNESNLLAKVDRFQSAGRQNLQIVLDFDRTLTQKSDENSTSWQLMRNHLPPVGNAEAQKIYEHYRPLEVAETLTDEDATTWWTSSMAIVAKYRLDMNIVEREFLSHATIRSGVKELFELCAQHSIPTIIMSAGIKDIITLWCKTYDIHPTIILSTELTVDEQNRVTGWNDASVVHMFNKHELDHPELSKIRSERPYTILAGDSIHDYNMADGTDNVIRVRILDHPSNDPDDQARARHETFTKFDAAIEDGTLNPLVGLIKDIAK